MNRTFQSRSIERQAILDYIADWMPEDGTILDPIDLRIVRRMRELESRARLLNPIHPAARQALEEINHELGR